MPERRIKTLISVLVLSLVVLVAVLLYKHYMSAPSLAEPGINAPDKPLLLQKFSLTTANGQKFDNESLKGQWSILFFGYTQCPDICSNTLAIVDAAYDRWTQEHKKPLQVVFISLDPQRDTPQILTEYASYFNPAFIAATAPNQQLKALTSQFGAFYEYENPDTGEVIEDVSLLPAGSKYAVHHIASLFVFDPQGRLTAEILPPPDIDRTVRALNKLQAHYGD